MAVDLAELIDPLKREVNPPGEDLFPAARDEEWMGRLADAFWEARLHGMLEGFSEADGTIVPIAGTADLTRDLQQLVVFYAAYRTVRTRLLNVKTAFRVQSGPVAYETAQSAQLLIEILRDLKGKLNLILERLSDLGSTNAVYFDAIVARDYTMAVGNAPFVGGAARGSYERDGYLR